MPQEELGYCIRMYTSRESIGDYSIANIKLASRCFLTQGEMRNYRIIMLHMIFGKVYRSELENELVDQL